MHPLFFFHKHKTTVVPFFNNFALKLRKYFPEIPWHSLKFEGVFSENGSAELAQLADFLEFPTRTGFLDSTSEKVDRFSRKKREPVDFGRIRDYGEAFKVMTEMGYSVDEIDQGEATKRYTKFSFSNLLQKARNLV